MDLQHQVEVGRQAEDFHRYINENPYFKELIERIKLEYAQRILSLRPEDKESFTTYKSKMNAFDDIENAVLGDIKAGEMALNQQEGRTPPEGIL